MAALPALWSAILVLYLGFSAAFGALLRPPAGVQRRLAAGAYLVFVAFPASTFVFSYLPWPWPFRGVVLVLSAYLVWIWSRPGVRPGRNALEVRLARRVLLAAMAAIIVWAAADIWRAPSLSPALVGAASVAAAAACLLPRKGPDKPITAPEVQ